MKFVSIQWQQVRTSKTKHALSFIQIMNSQLQKLIIKAKQQIVQYSSTLIWRLVMMQTLQQAFHRLIYQVNVKRVLIVIEY